MPAELRMMGEDVRDLVGVKGLENRIGRQHRPQYSAQQRAAGADAMRTLVQDGRYAALARADDDDGDRIEPPGKSDAGDRAKRDDAVVAGQRQQRMPVVQLRQFLDLTFDVPAESMMLMAA
jgi:hypothetical protein